MTAPVSETPAGEYAGYDPTIVERKWQERWRERGTNDTDLAGGARPF